MGLFSFSQDSIPEKSDLFSQVVNLNEDEWKSLDNQLQRY